MIKQVHQCFEFSPRDTHLVYVNLLTQLEKLIHTHTQNPVGSQSLHHLITSPSGAIKRIRECAVQETKGDKSILHGEQKNALSVFLCDQR